MTDKAQALLDAHVNWLSARLQGPELEQEIARQLDAFLEDAGRIRLKDVVKPSHIHATVKKYAVELTLGGAMPELVGDVVRALYAHKVHDKTALEDLMPDRMFEELLDKLLEFKDLRESVIRETVRNPIFSSMVTELLYQGIGDYLSSSSSKAAERLPGGKSALKLGRAMMSRASGELSSSLAEGLKAYVHKHTQTSLKTSEQHLHKAFESDEFRQVVLDIWDEGKAAKVGAGRQYVDSLDVEELFVILYEYWQHLRKSRYFSTLVNAGIDCFFAKFGQETLAGILDEIGITRDMMLDDAMRFAPPVIALLQKKKLLEPGLRRGLEGFYASEQARAILDS